ncbi:MAG: cyclase family protein [Actinobacteria bacterium]|nr:cyclase family protein [Actinomycetota bacterium]
MPLDEEQRALAARVSNWGRWGPDDQRGTLNLVDAAAVRRGAAAVRRGVTFSLSIPMDQHGPQTGRVLGRENPKHTTLVASYAFTGDPGDFATSDDKVETGLQSATHWDALAHAGYDRLLYNGVPADTISMEHGATKLGIEHFGPLVTRGVLCDVARLKGVDWFEEPHAITGGDLDGCVAGAGLTVEPGDVVLVRTGQMHWLRVGERERYADISPGIGLDAVEWLHDHDVAAIANDTHVFEPYPCPGANPFLFPVHMIELRDVGMPQGQQWDLDELAADCASDGVYEFLLSATPLPVTHGCGGLVAPTATK